MRACVCVRRRTGGGLGVYADRDPGGGGDHCAVDLVLLPSLARAAPTPGRLSVEAICISFLSPCICTRASTGG